MDGFLLVLGVVLLIALASWGMISGWRKRGERQAELIGELPTAPADPGAPTLASASGLYIGITIAPHWQDRIAVGDLGYRATATLTGFAAGILLERAGCEPLWMPVGSIVGVRTDQRLAGKVMTRDGLLVIRWRVPGTDGEPTEIDTGFRADDKTVYPAWKRAYAVPAAPRDTIGHPDQEGTSK